MDKSGFTVKFSDPHRIKFMPTGYEHTPSQMGSLVTCKETHTLFGASDNVLA